MKFLFKQRCLGSFTVYILDENEFSVGDVYDVDNAYNQIVENVEVGTPVGITASAIDADENDSVRYTLTDDAGGLFQIDENSGQVTVNEISSEIQSGEWVDADPAGSHSSALLVFERISDGGISVTTFTDRDGASPNIGEAIEWSMSRGDFADASRYFVVGRTLWEDEGPSRDIRDDWDWEIVTQAVRPSTAIDYETAISHDITVMATSDDGSNSTGSFIVSVVNDPNDDETLNTPPTQLGGIHRFGATFADGDIRQLSVSNFINGTDNETPTDQLGIAILGATSDQGFEYSLDGSNWFQLALGIEERIHLNQSSSVRFVPDHEDGDFGLNYLIWDQSNNVANGSVTNFGLTDPSDAYSSESAQLRIQVAPPIPNAPLYPPADIDQSVNAISEDALIGTTVGITAFVEDQDAADSVTYSLAMTQLVYLR